MPLTPCMGTVSHRSAGEQNLMLAQGNPVPHSETFQTFSSGNYHYSSRKWTSLTMHKGYTCHDMHEPTPTYLSCHRISFLNLPHILFKIQNPNQKKFTNKFWVKIVRKAET